MPKTRKSTCALCRRAVGSPVVCARCHKRAVDTLGEELRKLHGQLLTEQSANAILSLFKDSAYEQWERTHQQSTASI